MNSAVLSNPQQFRPRSIWFPAKRYGWGWGVPVAWQGWAVLVLWYALLIVGACFLAGRHWPAFAGFVAFMVLALIAVCYAKGERPRWRWKG